MSTAVIDLETIKEGVRGVLAYEYQTSQVVVLPYREKQSTVFSEEFLGNLYCRLKQDGTLATIFPGMNMVHLNHFISYMSKAKGLLICCRKTQTKPEPIGLGWLSEVDQVKGSFGFGFFKSEWRRRQHIDLSFLMLAYWMKEFNLQVLYGTTLNPVANNYSKRFGFRHLAVLPKFFVSNGQGLDAHLICLEKEVFLRYYSAWRG